MNTVFRDLTLLLMSGFAVMVIWMLPHLNPPAQDVNEKPPGNVIVHITWPTSDQDVDLWVIGPGEVKPVGYSNKGGTIWNLLRDDIGYANDITGINYENAYSRGIIAGEYIFNVQCYRCISFPVTVAMEVSVNKQGLDGKVSSKKLLVTKVELHRPKHEVTALRFKLTEDGKIVGGSVNHIFRKLGPVGGKPNP